MSELKALRDRTADCLAGNTALKRRSDVTRAAVLPTEATDLPAVIVSAQRVQRRSEGSANIGPPGYVCDGTIVIVLRHVARTPEDLEARLLDQAEIAVATLMNDAAWLSELEAVGEIDTVLSTTPGGEALIGDAGITMTCRWREDFGASSPHQFDALRGKLPDDTQPTFGTDYPRD
ncbi:hypothetical protein [Ancylobacter oerskovii]|uniref:Uncharacterized protein n=1 Tax=Ancylobacter oerskovii TaxID=459519 RepID=A0ABW4Z3C0_9HYPH|nr:hypothetical protein [Ancylobacter oerskovii]MBS7546243.1 hypothetical protein [Ancylobacter oerskovii]